MLLMFPAAHAWDGAVTGTIQFMDIVGGASGTPNYDLRVGLNGGPILCTGGVGWAYINANDPNYQALTAGLMMAKATGSKVTVFTVKDASGYCHIGYISVV